MLPFLYFIPFLEETRFCGTPETAVPSRKTEPEKKFLPASANPSNRISETNFPPK